MKKYLIGISYTGTSARKVKHIFERLRSRLSGPVFFDKEHEDELVGLMGKANLLKVYRELCEHVVVVCSGDYNNTYWTSEEWHTINAHVERSKIIPVSIDGSVPRGFEDAFFVKGREKSGSQIADAIFDFGLKKGFWTGGGTSAPASPGPGKAPGIPNLPSPVSELKSGLIIVGDVVNFSSLPPGKMPEVLTALWKTAGEANLLEGDWCALLDGIVVANPALRYRLAADACGEWLSRFANQLSFLKLRLRVALHRGDYCVLSGVNSSQIILAGQGPNECSRLVRMAGPGQIVVSQDYIDAWSHHEGWGPLNLGDSADFRPMINFDPRQEDRPHELVIKPGRVSRFRYYKYSLDDKDLVPEILLKNRARQGLEKWIKETAEDFLDIYKIKTDASLGTTTELRQAEQADEHIDLRVSLFVSDNGQHGTEQLGSILRYSTSDGLKWQGSTQYAVRSDQGEGPIGLAFVRKETFVLKDLPNYDDHLDQYIQILTGWPWTVDEQKVRRFQRKARCFLAIPLAMSRNLEPQAVLCIDTMSPLSHVEQDLLMTWSEHIAESYGVMVSSLLCVLRL